MSTPMIDEFPELSPVADHHAWYETWRDAAQRNLAKTAELCGVSLSTIQRAHTAERWRERVKTEDTQRRQDATQDGLARLASAIPAFVDVVVLTAAQRYVLPVGGHGRPRIPEGAPTNSAFKAALAGLAIFGIAPLRVSALHVSTQSVSARIGDHELDALIAAGMDGEGDALSALLALAAGAPPRDFASTQPGGRGVSGALPDVAEDRESASDGKGGAVFDALFTEPE